MAKRKRPEPELPLFDLPLHPEEDEPAAEIETGKAPAAKSPPAKSPAADRGAPDPEPPSRGRLFDVAEETAGDAEPAASEAAAPFAERLRAGLADLAVHVLMVAVAVTAAYRLGVRVTWDYWPPFAVLTLAFSFLYWMIPLAFWGQTPGMAWVGHLARSLDDEPLTFQQTFLRWLGALFTVGFAGLPLLLALGGSSLSDRLSQSKTVGV